MRAYAVIEFVRLCVPISNECNEDTKCHERRGRKIALFNTRQFVPNTEQTRKNGSAGKKVSFSLALKYIHGNIIPTRTAEQLKLFRLPVAKQRSNQ
jgi:hypothetical protein